LARRLDYVGLQALDKPRRQRLRQILARWPDAKECLVKEVLVLAAGRWSLAAAPAPAAIQACPARQVALPQIGKLAQHRDAGPNVLAALGIVAAGRQHRVRP